MDNSTLQDGVGSTSYSGTISKCGTSMLDSPSQSVTMLGTMQEEVEAESSHAETTAAECSTNMNVDLEKGIQLVEPPLFFNYHEFSERYYADVHSPSVPREHDLDYSICITHFPNVHTPEDSQLFHDTRIVRIPRRFDDCLDYPSFSTQLPGSEPAAIGCPADGDRFVARGVYDDGQVFGYSSVSPLSLYLSADEFQAITSRVNALLSRSYCRGTAYNILHLLADWVIFSPFLAWLIKPVWRDPALELENYVQEVNESELFRNKRIQIISPRRTGYLSLDFQIPRPTLDDLQIVSDR